jgi:hypothetical protein
MGATTSLSNKASGKPSLVIPASLLVAHKLEHLLRRGRFAMVVIRKN